jgi:hypothetical protein
MTEAQLHKAIQRWQQRLSPLGVGHWIVRSVTVSEDHPDGRRDACASVFRSGDYDAADFWFDSQWLVRTASEEIHRAIVHEWLHVAMRDLDNAINMDTLANFVPYTLRKLQVEQVDHEREGLIERLAVLIVQLYAKSGTL